MNLTNYYWYFQSAVPARICDEIVKYGKSISDQMAVTGGFGHGKNLNKKHMSEPHYNRTKSYGGQFHFDYPGLKDKAVFGMGGYGGRAILIDMENSRILIVNSLHYNNGKYKYNVKKLLLDPIKNGK